MYAIKIALIALLQLGARKVQDQSETTIIDQKAWYLAKAEKFRIQWYNIDNIAN